MAITKQIIKRTEPTSKKSGAPVVIRWKGHKLIRSHSIRACAYEILQASKIDDIVKVMLCFLT